MAKADAINTKYFRRGSSISSPVLLMSVAISAKIAIGDRAITHSTSSIKILFKDSKPFSNVLFLGWVLRRARPKKMLTKIKGK